MPHYKATKHGELTYGQQTWALAPLPEERERFVTDPFSGVMFVMQERTLDCMSRCRETGEVRQYTHTERIKLYVRDDEILLWPSTTGDVVAYANYFQERAPNFIKHFSYLLTTDPHATQEDY